MKKRGRCGTVILAFSASKNLVVVARLQKKCGMISVILLIANKKKWAGLSSL